MAELCNSFKNFFVRPPEATDGIAEEHNEEIEDTQTSVPDGGQKSPLSLRGRLVKPSDRYGDYVI